jgi:PAS domain S-box-containing protein
MERNRAYISLRDQEVSNRVAKALSGLELHAGDWVFEAKDVGSSPIFPGTFWVVEFDRLPEKLETEASGGAAGFVALYRPEASGETILSKFSPFLRVLPDSALPWEIGACLRDLAIAKSERTAIRASANPALSMRNLVAALPDVVYVLDEAGRFVFLNSSIESLGYSPQDLLGRHFSEILHPEDKDLVSRESVVARIRLGGSFPAQPPKLFDERRSGERMTRNLQVRVIRGDGNGPVYGSVNAYGVPILDDSLAELFECKGPVTIGVIHDITTSVLYQQSLEDNLASKALLLQELHHRVRDNLQVIASLAHLKQQGLDEAAKASLEGLSAQIRSIAMVHEALYSTESLTDVGVVEYFEKLGSLLTETYGKVGSSVLLEVKGDRTARLDADSLSYLALIASGFVAVAYREGFPGSAGGKIVICFLSGHGEIELVLSEDGADCSEQYRAEPDFEIAEALAAQLGGDLRLEGGEGTVLRVRIPPRVA